MSATLELPPPLREEVEENARKEGVTPAEHAALLLYITSALLRGPEQKSPFQSAVKEFFREHALDSRQVSSVLEELVQECLRNYAHESRSRGGKGEGDLRPTGFMAVLKEWRNWAVHHSPLSPPQPGASTTDSSQPPRRPRRNGSARGKYADVRTSSEAFARKKQDEIALEEGRGE